MGASLGASPRILIVRLSAIGDAIHGLPVLCALRERFPKAFLGWVVEEKAAALLRGHRALDELVELPRGWLKSPRTVLGVRRRLHTLRFDAAIDVQGLAKSAIATWLSGARRRIGFGDDKGRELSPWFYTERVRTNARHVIDCNLALLGPLGIESPAVEFQVPEHQCDRATAERIVGELGLHGGFAMINPGAGSVSRLWPLDRFAAVARHLAGKWRLRSLVVWAGEKERGFAEAIVSGAGGAALAAPPTSLPELAAVIRQARLFVSSCTGPFHLAEAVGTPSVGLFGPWPAERNGPHGPPHIAVQVKAFEGTTRQRRNAPREIMESIGVGLVCDACDRILGKDSREAA